MGSLRIANILVDDNAAFHTAPAMYTRSTCVIVPGDNPTSFGIMSRGTVDFTTFFNALSVCKWRTYTVAESFSLHLELRGAACTYVQTHAQKLDLKASQIEKTRQELPASDTWQTVDIPLVADERDVLVGFVLDAQGALELRGSYYAADVDDACVRPVELAIATTTFRKEDYITKNIALVRDQIIASSERAADHVTMHVVDNGRTLDAEALAGGGIYVHPNPNTGGAGGFARGMMEALAQEVPATHVLLMDDDVAVSPESILRTWNLLSLVRDEWSEAFVAGAMMSWDQPELLWEDGGFMTDAGVCGIVKDFGRESGKGPYVPQPMTSAQAIIANEAFVPSVESFPALTQRYAAWWYCCIPATTIRREGLPLPLFVRYDDVEYSLRCKPRFMTMNGICIWHLDFSLRYNAAVEHYQTTRNGFVIQATTNAAPLSNFEAQLHERAMIELTKFNYTDAELILRGFEDFLKGPGFLAAPGESERSYMEANRLREQLLPFDELREQVLAETGIDLADCDVNSITRDVPLGLTMHGRLFRVSRMQTFQRSLNGQLFGTLRPYAGPVAIVSANLEWPVGRIYGADTIVAIDIPSKRGVIRHRDNDRCKRIWSTLQDDINMYHGKKEEIDSLYRETRPLITSSEYWTRYLGLAN